MSNWADTFLASGMLARAAPSMTAKSVSSMSVSPAPSRSDVQSQPAPSSTLELYSRPLLLMLWALATYPKSEPPAQALELSRQATVAQAQGQPDLAAQLFDDAGRLTTRHALAHSLAGRMGRLIEPVIRPLGFDWQIGVGVVSSFAAREVIVSTLAVVYGVGADTADESPDTFYDTLRAAQRSDGSPVFNTATCVSLLVFYVLAMQCLPTQVVTRRETGGWRWPIFQLVYMTVLAYTAAFVAYEVTAAVVG